MLKWGLAVLVLMGASFIAGWQLSPGPFRYVYRISAQTLVTDLSGKVLAELPSGTPMLAQSKITGNADLGWWACVPVAMGTMNEAKRLVSKAPEQPKRIPWIITLNGISPADARKNRGSGP
jgi:hypothetical protein